ncbi:MAG: hypothetical protein M0C28_03800 [Candidatus Moduliflexus flocculans]|nr:hypothetical protein [Candidatus Moduliflexus flocculans]
MKHVIGPRFLPLAALIAAGLLAIEGHPGPRRKPPRRFLQPGERPGLLVHPFLRHPYRDGRGHGGEQPPLAVRARPARS